MKNKVIDVTGLTPRQIAIVEQIIAAFKVISQKNNSPQNLNQQEDEGTKRIAATSSRI
ncbi:hypothetical protein [Okeania sp.]|uniref:hypothetical protein n=1 Tax=Okeania sp. TaxID=3100323 RepID=UPI002B4AF58F|nr:hypothetical protein [Okeania sp.]